MTADVKDLIILCKNLLQPFMLPNDLNIKSNKHFNRLFHWKSAKASTLFAFWRGIEVSPVIKQNKTNITDDPL